MVQNHRLKALQRERKNQKLDAVLISKVANIIYLTDYFGFSTEEREVFLLITSKAKYIFTDGRYSEAIKKAVPDFKLIEISSRNKFPELLKDLIDKIKIDALGIEESDLKVTEYKLIKKTAKNLKDFKFHEHRSIKTKEESEFIESACKIGDEAFKFTVGKIRGGIAEKELMLYLESFIRQQGFEPSFRTIVAFGENSAIPHHQTGDRKLKKGDFVLLDFGVKFKNYCSDMTRTLVFGEASEKQKDIHETVKNAQKKAFEFLRANFKKGVKCSDLDKVARDYIIKSGYPSIPHSLGHGIGIEVHEHPYLSPNSKEVLRAGMVFSIEPGIYLPGFGGVRIEDLFIIEMGRVRQLTSSEKKLVEVY